MPAAKRCWRAQQAPATRHCLIICRRHAPPILQGRDERRDEWLRLAYTETPEAANAVLLTQADFQLDRGQYEQALATLRRLDENSKDHGHALGLMGRLYFQLEDWSALRDILPRVRKHAHVNPETLDLWTIRVHRESLDLAADGEATGTRLETGVKSSQVGHQLCSRLTTRASCEPVSTTGPKKNSSPRSNRRGVAHSYGLFGLVEGDDASKQLKRAEGWLAKHGEDPDLLLTAARLCLRNELWGKARSYLESVISLRPTPEAYQEYGGLLNQMGETDAAADAFRDGLSMVAGGSLPAIPHLHADPD